MSDFASLCVLSYNRSSFLKRCISTLVANAGAPFELIIHDDGTTDSETIEYIHDLHWEGFASRFILNSPGHNEGVGSAINRSFKIATGDPLIKIDQDLTFKPDWLKRTNQMLLDGRGEIGMLGLFHYHHDPVDTRKCMVKHHHSWEEHTHFCGSAFAMPRTIWEELGPFEEHSEAFAEDWTMMQKITLETPYHCALPPLDEDLVVNHGFGPPHSTVVRSDLSIEPIKRQVKVIA